MISIRLPKTTNEYIKGLDLLSKMYTQRFGTYPRELPGVFFLAFNSENKGKVIGTISINIKKDNQPLEVERYFNFNLRDICDYEGEGVAEVGRFTSLYEGLSTQLIAAAAIFVYKRGVERIISFNKRYITRLMTSILNSPPLELKAPINKENIPLRYRSYFMSKDNPVVILTWRIKDHIKRIEELRQQGKDLVNIDFSFSPKRFNQIIEQLKGRIRFS